MKIEIAKDIIDFKNSLTTRNRIKEIITEIHNVCISDNHFQNDQLSNISNSLNDLNTAIKSKKIVLDEAINAVEKITKNNKKMMLDINEYKERLLNELNVE